MVASETSSSASPGASCGLASVDEVVDALAAHGYLADEGLATAVFLAMTLQRPLLLEGEAGVGKTEVAKVLARWTGDEWDYARQLLHLRAVEASGESARAAEDELYDERFLVRRPLLRALEPVDGAPPILLVDEIDRADDEFEAFLLEILSEYAVTIPELGTVRAEVPPVVILTSNRTRDVHDALKRRCLYHWVEHPGFEREVAIVRLRAPQALPRLARQVAGAVDSMRALGLYKPPGVAETIDWAAAVAALGRSELDVHTVDVTLGTVLKYQEDQQRVRTAGVDELVRAAVLRGG